MSAGPTLLACGMRPRVGFSALIPQHWAGWRSDPRPSFPRPNGLMPVAIAAASPALEAPGVRDRSHGFTVAPHSSLSQCQRMAPLGRFVRPIGIAPAAFRRSTIGASRARIRVGQRLESLRRRRAGDVDVLLDGEGHAVERRQVSASGDRTVGRLGRFQRLLGQDDDNGVDRRVDRLDPPQVGLDDFLTGGLPGSDRFGQLGGAHAPQFGDRCDAHRRPPRRTAGDAIA